MKKLMILLAILIAGNVMLAQDRDYQDAIINTRNGYYDKAVKSIEKSVNHDNFLGMKPAKQAKVWLQRAVVYETILQTGNQELIAKYPNATDLAYESLMKCMENKDFVEDNKEDVYTNLGIVAGMYHEAGAGYFEKANYQDAVPMMKKAYDLYKILESPIANQLLDFTAIGCVMLKDYDKAIEYYQTLQAAGYESESLYHYLTASYVAKEQNDKAIETVAKGLQKYPSSEALIRENVNLKLSSGKQAEAINDLEKLLEAQPEDVTVMFALGNIYGNDTLPEFDSDKAVDYYTRAINLKPDYLDAIYNLGGLYIGMSNKLKAQANEITGVSKEELAQYDALIKQAEDLLRTGLPYVKQAYEAQPSPEVKSILKKMYVQLKMDEEAKALDEQ